MNRERIISFTPTTSPMRFDIMSDGRWRGTVKIDCTAGVVYKYDELKSFVRLTRPWLKGEDFDLLPTDRRVFRG